MVDFSSNQLVVLGSNLQRENAMPTVVLGELDLALVTASPTAVVAALPEGTNGDFRLWVSTGTGASQTDTFDVTIGAETLGALQCDSGQIPRWNPGAGWTCTEDIDTNTTYGSGFGITQEGTVFSIDVASLRSLFVGQQEANSISEPMIRAGAISSSKIQAGAVNGPQIANGAVGATHIQPNSIGLTQLSETGGIPVRTGIAPCGSSGQVLLGGSPTCTTNVCGINPLTLTPTFSNCDNSCPFEQLVPATCNLPLLGVVPLFN